MRARRITVSGVVQGVGFRPFVYQLANELSVAGWIRNDRQGVAIHVQGDDSSLETFQTRISVDAPSGAKVDSLKSSETSVEPLVSFRILDSLDEGSVTTRISVDLPTCPDCLDELFDPRNRRYLYPYINCSACGPRYSIIESLPYDRDHTTMREWEMCRMCREEYDDTTNRRHHAQPTACNDCGPNYRLKIPGQERELRGRDAITETAQQLRDGRIIAIKGIGGFHLACSARDDNAIRRLRERKHREEKPLAIMTRDLSEAKQLVHLTHADVELLTDNSRPILLAARRDIIPPLASELSPDSDEIGIMLPYAPIHNLLFRFDAPDPLVMTSGNLSDEPIAYEDADAWKRLANIADAFLIGDRAIARPVEDSVLSLRDGQPSMIRRGRGHTPAVVTRLPDSRPILAMGGDLKNSVALVVRGDVIVSAPHGDLNDLAGLEAFRRSVIDLLQMHGVDREELIVAHDLHPAYESTRLARELAHQTLVPVQHHHAHLASVVAESGDLNRPFIGLVLDGTGYGDDGAIWGCEVMAGSLSTEIKRISHLRSFALPGGDAAIRNPVQSAAGVLNGLDLPDLRQTPFSFPDRYDHAKMLVDKQVRCHPCSSAGRLFDTVAAICGFTREVTYQGQAAIWLEGLARQSNNPCFETPPFDGLDPSPFLQFVIEHRRDGGAVFDIAAAFHRAFADALTDAAIKASRLYSADEVILSGGVFQNRILRSAVIQTLREKSDLNVCSNHVVPCNDGGIALGQAAIASIRSINECR